MVLIGLGASERCLEIQMRAEVEQTSAVEPHKIKMSATTTSSSASATGSKVSIFAAKSGFVIPKNKLSGSLVPIFRGGKKLGGDEAASEDNNSRVPRKSKWGPDPTQDADVRRGRALAYQTRVDQIAQQLKSGILETEETQDSQIVDQHADLKLSISPIDTMESELLKLERLETIGEILKLNPSYKAPPDYVPLQKEAIVPIPVKDHPGYDFVGLILGPGGETQKRLEKETGAKIQLCGTKANNGKKVEISSSDGYETHVAYEELNVHISADTFDKVDGAVSLIELLITSVSGNLVVGNSSSILNQNQEAATPFIALTGDHEVVHSVLGPAQSPRQGQFLYEGSQLLAAVSAQTPGYPPPASIPLQNSSASIHINRLPVHTLPLNSTTMPSLFGPRPIPAPGFNSIFPHVPSMSQQPMQGESHPYPPINFSVPAPQPLASQASVLASHLFTGNQAPPALPSPVARPLVPSLPSLSQSAFSVAPGPQPDRPLIPVGSSSRWSAAPAGAPASLDSGNMGQMVSPRVSLQGPRPVVLHPGFLSTPPSNIPAANTVSPASFPSTTSTINVPMNHPTGASSFASVPPSQVGPTAPLPIQSSPMVLAAAPVARSSKNLVSGNSSISLPMVSTSQPTQQLGIIRPTVTAPKPMHSGPGDFTFQPHHPQNPAQSVPWPSNQSLTQNPLLPRQMMHLPSPQAPSFRLAMSNSNPLPAMHLFPRSQLGNQLGQTQAHISANPFTGNSAGNSNPPRIPAFSSTSPNLLPTRNFNPGYHQADLAGPFLPRPSKTMQVQQNYQTPLTLQGTLIAQNQQFSKNPPFTSGPGGQQIYDPFSPSSVPIMPKQQGGNVAKERKQEADPEYEDLMASVGVK